MSLSLLHIIDVAGTCAFAISGAFSAIEKRLDPFGVLVLSFVTAIGGGTLRDIMIGNLPVGWLRNETATVAIFASALATLFFSVRLRKWTTTLFLFDALGLGLFTIIGIELGLEKQFSMGVCIALGTITASFGGVIRDVLLNNVPLIFQKEIYAMASVAGGVVYFLLNEFSLSPDTVRIASILVIFCIRILAVRYRLSLPSFYQQNKQT